MESLLWRAGVRPRYTTIDLVVIQQKHTSLVDVQIHSYCFKYDISCYSPK